MRKTFKVRWAKGMKRKLVITFVIGSGDKGTKWHIAGVVVGAHTPRVGFVGGDTVWEPAR